MVSGAPRQGSPESRPPASGRGAEDAVEHPVADADVEPLGRAAGELQSRPHRPAAVYRREGVRHGALGDAVDAAVAGAEPRWVEVSLLDDGDTLALAITDSGPGVDDPENVFENARRREDLVPADAVHGRGIGLPLARRFARRRGGGLWLVEARGEGHGAVFAARPRDMPT